MMEMNHYYTQLQVLFEFLHKYWEKWNKVYLGRMRVFTPLSRTWKEMHPLIDWSESSVSHPTWEFCITPDLRALYHTRPYSSGPWPSAAVKILHGMIEMTSREGLKVKFDNRCWSWWRTLICNLDTSFWDKTELVIKSKMFFKICKEFSQAFPPVSIIALHNAWVMLMDFCTKSAYSTKKGEVIVTLKVYSLHKILL